jgi:hypothetical protein
MQYVGTGRLGTTQSVAFTGTAGTITTAINVGVYKVRVMVSSDAYVKIDNTPTATSADAYLPAFAVEYFTISPGQKVSAVQVSAGGTLYVTEIV